MPPTPQMLQRCLDDTGDLTTVLVHTFAHVLANPDDLSNDLDPVFQRHFHRLLRACGQLAFQAMTAAAEPSTVPAAHDAVQVRGRFGV